MKFSLFYEMQISRPTRQTEAQLFHQSVAQIVRADQLGYHAVWAVEHHGLYEYAHLSAPETLLAYVAAKTERIRLGHGISLTPYRYNHPIRVAERVATLDILSGGRVDWGSGKSASRTEQAAFEIDPAELHDQWLEALEMIPRMWREQVFSHKGRFFDIPPTQVVPRPVQTPHPPIFAACTRPDSTTAIGELGIGALNFAVGNDDFLAQKVSAYKRAVAAASPSAYYKNDHFASAPVALCLADDRRACEYGFRGARYFSRALETYYYGGDRPIGPLDIPREFLSERDLRAAMNFRGHEDAMEMIVIGDPARCREMVARFAAAGVDEMILMMQMGTVPHEMVMESIVTFGEQVMPHFA